MINTWGVTATGASVHYFNRRTLADGPLGDRGQSATADFRQAQAAEGFYACVPLSFLIQRKWLSKGHQGDD